MSRREFVKQPLTGFGYSYWLTCTGCGARVNIAADLYELQCTGRAALSACECGTEVDITSESPTFRDVNDIALQNDSVETLVWYHSSRFENRPDTAAYTAEVTAIAAATAARFFMFDPDRYIEERHRWRFTLAPTRLRSRTSCVGSQTRTTPTYLRRVTGCTASGSSSTSLKTFTPRWSRSSPR